MSHRDLDDRELRALAFVDERELVRDLIDLVAVPSVSGSDAESDVQHRLAKQLRGLDLDVDLWSFDLEELTADAAFPGWEVERSESWGLVAGPTLGGETPALVLQGHVDVVPAGDLGRWSGEPFVPRVAGGQVHGRGTVDMKAGVVAMLAAARRSGLQASSWAVLPPPRGRRGGRRLGAFGTLRRGHRGEVRHRRADLRDGHHRQRRSADLRDLGPRLRDARQHAVRRCQRVRRVPAGARGAGPARAGSERRHRPVDGGVPDRLPPLDRPGRLRRLVEQRARPSGRRGSSRSPAGRGPRGGARLAGARVAAPRRARGCATPADGDLDRRPVRQRPVRRRRPAALRHGERRARRRDRGPAPAAGPSAATSGSTRRPIPTLHYGPGDVRLAHGPDESVPVAELVTVTEALVLTLLRTCR